MKPSPAPLDDSQGLFDLNEDAPPSAFESLAKLHDLTDSASGTGREARPFGVNRPENLQPVRPGRLLRPDQGFPREVGWGNAMRYLLTGDQGAAEEAYRMGVIQQIDPNPA